MAASMAAASRLLNPRNPAVQSLIRRHLLLHSAAASSAMKESLSLNAINLEKDSTNRYPSDSRNQDLQSLNLPLNLRCRFGFSPVGIEAARTNVPIEDADYQDLDDEEDDDDDMDDEEEDDFEIQGYSGSDLDDAND